MISPARAEAERAVAGGEGPIRVSPRWLALRESADAAARSRELVAHVVHARPAPGRWVVHDLACGAGAMGRWLAPLLPGPQHWIAHDRDRDLLELAAGNPPHASADGAPVTVETRHTDITRLRPADLAGASLVTASALLDLLAAGELDALAALGSELACPILLSLSVTGHVALQPADPLDERIAAAFDAHQRRATDRGRLLGPDAVAAAVAAFTRRGAEVLVHPSPWRLGASQAALAREWLAGWVDAACEQQPGLAVEAAPYASRRRAQAAGGRLGVIVDHADVLVLPAPHAVSKRADSA